MRVLHAIVVISLVVVSSVAAGLGINYIHATPNLPRATMLTDRRSDTKVRFGEISEVGESRSQRHANADGAIREKKTLAVLLLMLRDGRGAR
jgi:hypothetical protein